MSALRDARAPLALALSLAFAGCLDFLRGEGEESLTIRNADVQPVEIILTITHEASGLRVFGEDVVLQQGDAREYPLVMRPGDHLVSLTTSTRLSERFGIAVPDRGDAHFELVVRRGSASLTQLS